VGTGHTQDLDDRGAAFRFGYDVELAGSALKQVVDETNGSLGTHLRRLEDAG